MIPIRAALFLLVPWMMISCRTVKSVVAAVDVKPTGFLPHASELKEDRKRSPFIGNWWNTDKRVVQAAESVKSIYIAPVVADQLKPMRQKFTKLEFSDERRDKKIRSLLKYTQEKFVRAFKSNKKSRFSVVDAPSKDAMTLRLSIIEWEPNTYSGLAVREAVDLVTLPMVGSVLGKPSRGMIAIEGVLTEPKTGKSFFEFADKEEAKSLFFFFPQELFPSGQAKYAIREWARQFEKLMSTPPDTKVKDSMPFQIIAF
ncbi:DUF3313 family protein [Prosthecobacter sp.]|uniref:DUF3313 family protein n=1 Tax=Prosthecobacter sp. TaxID=1965333 RepID=UPI001DF09EB6|nr:DUF3313 family protein [Prosthecobacter sp.]MCB1277547.1 DUF3313 family protein [Prosthecobacter sp.]